MEILIAWVGLVVVMAVVILVAKFVARRNARYERIRRMNDEIMAKIAEEKRQWAEKVSSVRHLLTGSWRDPDGKKEFVLQLYGRVPNYLWYLVDEGSSLSEEEAVRLIDYFWPPEGRDFGDFEVHKRSYGILYRIRNARQFATEITVGGRLWPLIQTGATQVPWDENPAGVVVFPDLMPDSEPATSNGE